jgi:hypothetical protein
LVVPRTVIEEKANLAKGTRHFVARAATTYV